MTGKLPPEQAAQLAKSLAAYELILDTVITEAKYFAGARDEDPRVAVWGSIIERGAARRAAAERTAQQQQTAGPAAEGGPARHDVRPG